MKKYLILFLLSIGLNAHATFWLEITNPCVNVASVFEEVDVFAPATVSDVVRFFFPSFDIPYEANESQMIQIFKTPVGQESIEYITDTNFRIYGWCYEVDGILPDVTMDQQYIDPILTKKIRWFYGYAEYLNNEWINYCEPLYNHPDQFICAGK